MKRRTIENLNRKDVGRTSVFPSLVSLGDVIRSMEIYVFFLYIYRNYTILEKMKNRATIIFYTY